MRNASLYSRQNWIYTAAYVWLALPIMLFLFGWIRPVFSLPLAALLLYGFWKTGRIHDSKPGVDFHKRKLWIGLAIILCWAVLSGIGGYLFQYTGDHTYRNAIYSDLANRPWPVVGVEDGTQEMLCYYFGFWLPSAFMSKIICVAEIGYITQLVYAIAGTMLAILMVYRYIGSVSLWIPVLFMFFSGIDLAGALLFQKQTFLELVINLKDLSYMWFSSPSTTIQLYFIYNQGVAAWLVFMLLLNQRDNPGSLLFTFCLLPLFSPISAAGVVIPVSVGLWKGRLRSCTLANLGGLLLGIVIALFYLANKKTGGAGFYEIYCKKIIVSYVAFFIFTYLIYFPFVWKRIRRNTLFWLLFLPLFFLVWIKLGTSHDFAWRVTMGCSFYLMLIVMKEMVSMPRRWDLRRVLLVCVLGLAMFGGAMVALKSALINIRELRNGNCDFRVKELPTTFMPNKCHDSFVCERAGIFAEHLMNQPEPANPQ